MIINDLLSLSKLYNKNSPKFIYYFFKIDPSINIKDIDRDEIYKFNYLEKKKKKTEEEKKEYNSLSSEEKRIKRYEKYLNIEKGKSKQLKNRPEDFNEKIYRRLTIFNPDFLWVKKFQRKFHSAIVKVLTTENLPYLQSTIKNVSYATNANAHKGDRHAFIIDMENFFTQIDEVKVKKCIKRLLKLNEDTANIYTKLLTSPADEPPHHNGRYVIGQGLPSSPLLAFLCNSSFFDYLNRCCVESDIKMTIYVDDIVFSSTNPITQEFINRLFTLFSKNGLIINRKKCARVKNTGVKKITGGFVSQTGVRVKNSKREEINVIYNKLFSDIKTIKSLDDYFDVYNLFLKFSGNYYFLMEMECKENGKYKIPLQYTKYKMFFEKYNKYFPRGINKIDDSPYSKHNVKKDDLIKFNNFFQQLKSKI